MILLYRKSWWKCFACASHFSIYGKPSFLFSSISVSGGNFSIYWKSIHFHFSSISGSGNYLLFFHFSFFDLFLLMKTIFTIQWNAFISLSPILAIGNHFLISSGKRFFSFSSVLTRREQYFFFFHLLLLVETIFIIQWNAFFYFSSFLASKNHFPATGNRLFISWKTFILLLIYSS